MVSGDTPTVPVVSLVLLKEELPCSSAVRADLLKSSKSAHDLSKYLTLVRHFEQACFGSWSSVELTGMSRMAEILKGHLCC